MAYNTKNIIHGAAGVFYSVKSSLDTGWDSVSLPAYSPTTSFQSSLSADTANWHHVGLTTEGVDVEYSPEFKDVEVDQLLDAAEIYKTKQTMTVTTTLVEATLEHLLFVWGMSESQIKTTTAFDGSALPAGDRELGIYEGALGEAPVERQLAFVGPGPKQPGKKTERVYYLRRVLQVEASSHGLKRAEETVFPASFRCLPDPSASFVGAGYGIIRERAYT
jgi:hypothetical protein